MIVPPFVHYLCRNAGVVVGITVLPLALLLALARDEGITLPVNDFLGNGQNGAEYLWKACGPGLLCLLVLVSWPRPLQPRASWVLVLGLVCLLVLALGLSAETIGSYWRKIPDIPPAPALPSITFGQFRELMAPIATLVLLAGLEMLRTALHADDLRGQPYRSNLELLVQGMVHGMAPLGNESAAPSDRGWTTINLPRGAARSWMTCSTS
jgi:MFS superfamily sulfate permease-like transporter